MERNKELDYKPYTIKWIDDEANIENRLIDGCGWESIVEMANKEANGRSIEVWTRPRWDGNESITGELLYSRLSDSKQMELDSIMGDMVDEAKSMVEDFVDNPSELSGEIDFKNKKAYGDGIRIHHNSPQLDEDEKNWKTTEDMIDEEEKENN